MVHDRKLMGVSGQVALITGAGSGIGQASAHALAAAGAIVVVTDIDLASAQLVCDEIAAIGGNATAEALDVTDEAAWESVVSRTAAHLGPIGILHSNAAPTGSAVMQRDLDIVTMDVEVWDFVIRVVLRGNMLACKYVLPAMIDSQYGTIIVTSSVKGHLGSTRRSAYGTAKGALEQYVRIVATEYGRYGVRCNAIAPGLIDTPALRISADDRYLAEIEEACLIPRLGLESDITAAILYLASAESAYMTGQTLVIDGGLTSYMPVLSPPLG